MNKNQLETFLAVSNYESYSKAALALGITQPTVTSRIKALEDSLEYELFNRVGHEISLTEEGVLFTEYAKNILLSMKHAKEVKHMIIAPVIKVGFSPGYSYSFIIEILKAVKSVRDIDIEIIDGYDSANLNQRLLLGEVDLVFTRDNVTDNPIIISEYLFDNPLVAVLPNVHPLSEKESLMVEDLHNETIISFKRDSELWSSIDQLLIRAHNTTRIDVENNEMLLSAVANNLGIGIIPKLGVDSKYKSEIVVKDIDELDKIHNKVFVHYRTNAQTKRLARKIIYTVINHKYSKE